MIINLPRVKLVLIITAQKKIFNHEVQIILFFLHYLKE